MEQQNIFLSPQTSLGCISQTTHSACISTCLCTEICMFKTSLKCCSRNIGSSYCHHSPDTNHRDSIKSFIIDHSSYFTWPPDGILERPETFMPHHLNENYNWFLHIVHAKEYKQYVEYPEWECDLSNSLCLITWGCQLWGLPYFWDWPCVSLQPCPGISFHKWGNLHHMNLTIS